ncbi:hydroxyacylglutathione hydrolase [Chitinivorax sp. B]|uniref:hydroxyacylglutathione hydrolase n=1 Tax=Chitinivorax sp. B TaxID=2502235 RepID=UPI0010F7C293|nr:hydroxyacylglutathione hydrolase [Chitinivorax sp. B]
MDIFPIPAFNDNYIWLLREGPHAVVVDPGDAQPVRDYLTAHQLTLVAILVTHHHADHVGGVNTLHEQWSCPVYGPAITPFDGITAPLMDGETLTLPMLNLTLQVMAVPGHTLDHIAFYTEGMLLCGDTLFACGCGRLFEGTPAQMHQSLGRLAALPDDTKVYCTHEYTLSNQRFALAADPNNLDLQIRHRQDQASRDQGRPTLPTTIGMEKRTNPFLRHSEPAVITQASQHTAQALAAGLSTFAALRAWKDHF